MPRGKIRAPSDKSCHSWAAARWMRRGRAGCVRQCGQLPDGRACTEARREWTRGIVVNERAASGQLKNIGMQTHVFAHVKAQMVAQAQRGINLAHRVGRKMQRVKKPTRQEQAQRDPASVSCG